MKPLGWSPKVARRHLREAREAATPIADLALVRAAVRTVVGHLDVLPDLDPADPDRDARIQQCVERLSWAAEHLARRVAEDDLPF